MDMPFPFLGYQEKCEQVPAQFPPQHQLAQPGLETQMDPKPTLNTPAYAGTGRRKGNVDGGASMQS